VVESNLRTVDKLNIANRDLPSDEKIRLRHQPYVTIPQMGYIHTLRQRQWDICGHMYAMYEIRTFACTLAHQSAVYFRKKLSV
jgi:hypothetical protein